MCSLNSGSENLDWETLPKELYYLCGPVEKFYPYYYDDVTTANARFEMTSDEMAELKKVGQKIKENHHFALINRWIDAQGDAAWSKAVACLYFFIGLLDMSDISFE